MHSGRSIWQSPMLDAAKRGEKKIIAEPREVIKLPKGGSIYLQDDFFQSVLRLDLWYGSVPTRPSIIMVNIR